MAHTSIFEFPPAKGGESPYTLVIYTKTVAHYGGYQTPQSVAHYVLFNSGEYPKKPTGGTIEPSTLEDVQKIHHLESSSFESYAVSCQHGMLTVKSGNPVVEQLFHQLGDISYRRWRKAPGVLVQVSYGSYYCAALGLVPSLKDHQSESVIAFYPWHEVCPKKLQCA